MPRETIIVVDDEPFIRDILKSILEEFYAVLEASDGEEGLALIRKKNPALAILDYKMPKKTGLEVCKEIREDPLFLHLPIIILTGKGELQDKIEGLDAGADDYLVKPFRANDLFDAVESRLDKKSKWQCSRRIQKISRLGSRQAYLFLRGVQQTFQRIRRCYKQ